MFLHRKANVVGIWWWWGSVVVTDRKLTLVDSGQWTWVPHPGQWTHTWYQTPVAQRRPVISCTTHQHQLLLDKLQNYKWRHILSGRILLIVQFENYFYPCWSIVSSLPVCNFFHPPFILLSSSEVFCFWNYNHVFFCQIIEAASLKHQLDKLSALDNLPRGQLTETVLEFK